MPAHGRNGNRLLVKFLERSAQWLDHGRPKFQLAHVLGKSGFRVFRMML